MEPITHSCPEGGKSHGSKEDPGFLAALVADDQCIGCGLTHRIRQIFRFYKIFSEQCRKYNTEDHAGKRYHDKRNLQRVIGLEAEHPYTRNRKSHTARNHGTGTHNGMSHIDLIDIGVSAEL